MRTPSAGTAPSERASPDARARLSPGRAQGLVFWGLIAIGVGLRVWQFAGFTSLFIDEVSLARNIAERSYSDLLRPLDYGQVAPAGFLLVERLLWSLFHTDWSLRIFPLGAAIASVFLFSALARRTVAGIALPLAVATFVVGVPFILHGSQAKQYSTDVALTLVILLATLRVLDHRDAGRWRRDALAGLAGFLVVWFSNTAVFVVAGAGAVLGALVLSRRITERRRLVRLTLVPWAVGAMAAAAQSKHAVSPQTMAYMSEFWSSGFAPWPPWTPESLLWPWHALHGVFGMPDGLGYPFLASIYTLLAIGGLVVLWCTRRVLTLVLAGPVVVTLGAAVAHLYPFSGRLVLFLTPIFLLAAATAGARAIEWLGRRNRLAGALLALLILAPPFARILTDHPIYEIQPSRRLFDWLRQHRHAGDVLLVWYRAAPAFAWYGVGYGLTTGDTVLGGCWLGEPRRFLGDIDRVRGRPRVWLVLAGAGTAEAKLMLRYADQIGTRRDGISMLGSHGVLPIETWLYDFGDSTKLTRAWSDTFPVSLRPVPRSALLACATGPVATRKE